MSLIKLASFAALSSFSFVSSSDESVSAAKIASCHIEGNGISGDFEFYTERYVGFTYILGKVFNLVKSHRHDVQIVENIDENGKNYVIFDPDGKNDSWPWDKNRKVGNIGSVLADEYGIGRFELVDQSIRFEGDKSVVYKKIALFENTHDFMQVKDGNKELVGRGKILASGVILPVSH
jgi:hypothetical protein